MHFLPRASYTVVRGGVFMPWQRKIRRLYNMPVGVSFINGRGTSGILCGAQSGELYILEYICQDQFALKRYDFNEIDDINPFPPCNR